MVQHGNSAVARNQIEDLLFDIVIKQPTTPRVVYRRRLYRALLRRPTFSYVLFVYAILGMVIVWQTIDVGLRQLLSTPNWQLAIAVVLFWSIVYPIYDFLLPAQRLLFAAQHGKPVIARVKGAMRYNKKDYYIVKGEWSVQFNAREYYYHFSLNNVDAGEWINGLREESEVSVLVHPRTLKAIVPLGLVSKEYRQAVEESVVERYN